MWRPGSVDDGPTPEPIATIEFNWTLVEQSGDAVTYIDQAPIITGLEVPPSISIGQLKINSPQNLQGDFISNSLVMQALYADGDTRFSIGNPLDTSEGLNFLLSTAYETTTISFAILAAGPGNHLGIDPEVPLVLPLYPAVEPEFYPHDYWTLHPYKYLDIWPENTNFIYYNVVHNAHDNVVIDQSGNLLPPANPRPHNFIGTLRSYTSYNSIDGAGLGWAVGGGSININLIEEGETDYIKFIVFDFNDGQEKFLLSYMLGEDGPIVIDTYLYPLIQEDPWEVDSGPTTKLALEVYDAGYYTPNGYELNFAREGSPSRIDNYLTATYAITDVLGGLYSAELKVYQYYDNEDNIISVSYEIVMSSSYTYRHPVLVTLGEGFYQRDYELKPVRNSSGVGHKLVASVYEYSPNVLPWISPEIETITFRLITKSFIGKGNRRFTNNFSISEDPFEGLVRDPDIEDLRLRMGVRPAWFNLPHEQIIFWGGETEFNTYCEEFLIIHYGLLKRTSVGPCVDIGFRPRQLDRLGNAAGEWKIILDVTLSSTRIEFLVDLGPAPEDKLYEYTLPITQAQWNGMQSSTWSMEVSIERPGD